MLTQCRVIICGQLTPAYLSVMYQRCTFSIACTTSIMFDDLCTSETRVGDVLHLETAVAPFMFNLPGRALDV